MCDTGNFRVGNMVPANLYVHIYRKCEDATLAMMGNTGIICRHSMQRHYSNFSNHHLLNHFPHLQAIPLRHLIPAQAFRRQ